MPAPFRRRTLIKAAGTALSALPLRGFAFTEASPVHFTHHVASGDPLADRVMLWTRLLPGDGAVRAVGCRWEIAPTAEFTTLVASGTATATPERDYTVKVDAKGLQPGQSYCYRFVAEGVTSPVGCTRTLPVGDVSQFKLGVASCSNYPQGFFHAYREMAKAELDAILHLGDYIYEYPVGEYVNPAVEQGYGRQVTPEHELLVLEDYRMRYGLYRSDPDLQAAHAAHPWITVWDDHEIMNDTWRKGAENHNEGEGDFAARVHAARQAYHEWLPIRPPAEGDQGVIYRSFQVGNLADLIMLDTRLVGRDQQLNYLRDLKPEDDVHEFLQKRLNASKRTLLGKPQEEWLARQLTTSKKRGAVWQVLGQQVLMGKLSIPEIPADALASMTLSDYSRARVESAQQLAPLGLPLNLDAWDGYPAARTRLYRALLKSASNPISLAGDTHNGWAFNLADNKGKAVGVEIGTPGVTSPGLETYLPMPSTEMASLLLESSPELAAVDTAQRGWTEMTLTPEAMTSQWRFVSDVALPTYTTTTGPLTQCRAGARKLS